MRNRFAILKLIIPIGLLTIYCLALYSTVTEPVEVPAGQAAEQTDAEAPPMPAAPRPILTPAANQTDSGIPDAPAAPSFNPTRSQTGIVSSTAAERLIPAIEANWLQPDELVLGVEVNGQALAFPIQQMSTRQVINLEFGGMPLAVTYCSISSSGTAFSPRYQDQRLDLEMMGLYNGLCVLTDLQTGSLWLQLDGSAIQGPMVEQQASLGMHPLARATWETWKAWHPDTQVLDRDATISADELGNVPDPGSLWSRLQKDVLNHDQRLAEEELVLGVSLGEAAHAFALNGFRPGQTIRNTELGGTPLVIFSDQTAGYAMAFQAELDGRLLVFSLKEGLIQDSSGTVWNLEGAAIEGSLAGQRLAPVPAVILEWYAWVALHPETDLSKD